MLADDILLPEYSAMPLQGFVHTSTVSGICDLEKKSGSSLVKNENFSIFVSKIF